MYGIRNNALIFQEGFFVIILRSMCVHHLMLICLRDVSRGNLTQTGLNDLGGKNIYVVQVQEPRYSMHGT